MQAFPNTPDDLIAELGRRFPERVPSPSDTQADIMFHAGQRSVVTALLQWRAQKSLGADTVFTRGEGRPKR